MKKLQNYIEQRQDGKHSVDEWSLLEDMAITMDSEIIRKIAANQAGILAKLRNKKYFDVLLQEHKKRFDVSLQEHKKHFDVSLQEHKKHFDVSLQEHKKHFDVSLQEQSTKLTWTVVWITAGVSVVVSMLTMSDVPPWIGWLIEWCSTMG